MRSENLDGAANQQERLSSEERRFWFLAGVVEGEGSVCVSVRRHPTASFGYYVQPMFFIYQHEERRALLEMAQEFFRGGRIRPKPGNEVVLVYSVQSRPILEATVVPFLRECLDLSSRTADYLKFIEVVARFERQLHRAPEGLADIVRIAYTMNQNGKQRRQPLEPVLDRILRGHMPDAR